MTAKLCNTGPSMATPWTRQDILPTLVYKCLRHDNRDKNEWHTYWRKTSTPCPFILSICFFSFLISRDLIRSPGLTCHCDGHLGSWWSQHSDQMDPGSSTWSFPFHRSSISWPLVLEMPFFERSATFIINGGTFVDITGFLPGETHPLVEFSLFRLIVSVCAWIAEVNTCEWRR
jgi:hypothetical protein